MCPFYGYAMGVKWDGRGSEYNFGQPLSIGRDVPLLSIRAHGSSGEGSAAQAVADASPDFPGDAAGEKALSWCAFLGIWGTADWRKLFSQCAAGRAAAYRPTGACGRCPGFLLG